MCAPACDSLAKDSGASAAPIEPRVDFIGAPCETDADCPYTGGICLPDDDGLPRGHCSSECDQYCPDEDGHPTTFCIDRSELPRRAQERIREGACVSRCDWGAHTDGGCRADYGCQQQSRIHQPDRETWVCLPGSADARLPECYQRLADRGVGFEADIRPPDPLPGTSRQCAIRDAVWLDSPLLGVDLVYDPDPSVEDTLADCSLGHALADTVDGLDGQGVTAIRHLGTYACRTVSGTSTLSRHAYGDAIDIAGFDFRDGSRLMLVDDWEHRSSGFSSDEAAWLYDLAWGWHRTGTWSVVLTPNANAAHDDHYHLDLTPGSSYFARRTPPWLAAGTFTPNPAGE